MSKFIIQGGNLLKGTINVAGNKNAVLPIMAATLLVEGTTTLENVPRIRDVASMADILVGLGAVVEGVGSSKISITTDLVKDHHVAADLASRLRASVLLLGPLFGRFKRADLAHPGGDIIGRRSIDTHLTALEALGGKITVMHSIYHIEKSGKILPKKIPIFLDEPTVTGTENCIMACVLGDRTIEIENAACEPHIVDLISFLNACGADISGAGTHKLIIKGKKHLNAMTHQITPDYLEAGTFAVLSLLTGGKITIENCNPDDSILPISVLKSMGANVHFSGNTLSVSANTLVSSPKRIQAAPHPNFPTDLMSPFIVLATQARGQTLFHDPMYESRMFFVDKLISMGANITICDPHRVIVSGPSKLHGSYQTSPDIRAGIALVIAALIADGESIIDHAEIIERGYENIADRLKSLGANIKKVE